jgi:hypothetical protein
MGRVDGDGFALYRMSEVVGTCALAENVRDMGVHCKTR